MTNNLFVPQMLDINLVLSYMEMLSYRRPARTHTEKKFIEKFIMPLEGATKDNFGNILFRIGNDPILWSCHTDTVHLTDGIQLLTKMGDYVFLNKEEKTSNCLGADCTSGVWLMLEMIKEGIPGLYIFHREEECGGRGSRYIAENLQEILSDIQFAIAFDRRGKNSIITHQLYEQGTSQTFVDSITPMLPYGYKQDSEGIFTDTANYIHLIPECTNLSVGFEKEHTHNENQCLSHLFKLRKAIFNMDLTKLVAERDPSTSEIQYWNVWDFASSPYEDRYEFDYKDKISNIQSILRQYPNEIADLLEAHGYDVQTLLKEVGHRTKPF